MIPVKEKWRGVSKMFADECTISNIKFVRLRDIYQKSFQKGGFRGVGKALC